MNKLVFFVHIPLSRVENGVRLIKIKFCENKLENLKNETRLESKIKKDRMKNENILKIILCIEWYTFNF